MSREPDRHPLPVRREGDDLVAEATSIGRRSGALARTSVDGTVYLLVDHSTSMADDDKLPQAKRGALRFFAEAWQRNYAIGAIGFASRATHLIPAGRDFHRFSRRLRGLEADGRTAMASAIRMAARRLRRRRGERLILLITDGMPDNRAATLEAARTARALGITLIAIGVDGADESFLGSLTPRPELARKVAVSQLEASVGEVGRALPEARR